MKAGIYLCVLADLTEKLIFFSVTVNNVLQTFDKVEKMALKGRG